MGSRSHSSGSIFYQFIDTVLCTPRSEKGFLKRSSDRMANVGAKLPLVLASKRLPQHCFSERRFKVKRVTALNFLPDFYLSGLQTAGLLVDEEHDGARGDRGAGGRDGDGGGHAAVLERYRAVGRGAGARRLLCLLVAPSYDMQRWVADHLPHAKTMFLSHRDEVGDAILTILPVLCAVAGRAADPIGDSPSRVGGCDDGSSDSGANASGSKGLKGDHKTHNSDSDNRGDNASDGIEENDNMVSQTARYIKELENDTWEESLAVSYRAESIAMCTGVDAGTVNALLCHFGNSIRRLAAASTLLLRERFGVAPTQAQALADFFSAVEMVPPLIVYATPQPDDAPES